MKLADRFREHLCNAEKDDKDASKYVAHLYNLPHQSTHNMTISGLFPQQGNTQSGKNLKQKIIYLLGTLNPYGQMNATRQ